MKKATKVALGVLGGVIVIAAVASSGDKPNTQNVQNSNASQQQSSEEKTATEKLTIKNSTYKESSGMKQVIGEVTNNDSSKHTATIKATFYNADGQILGTAIGTVTDLAPAETKTFNLFTADDIANYKDMKIQVDTLL